jgi:hypothetical protein
MKCSRRSARAASLLLLTLVAVPTRSALAQSDAIADAPGAQRRAQAEGHFRRGVSLFKDNDYAGALVEFQRAYDIAPNYRILYNIGQAQYQLQRYADALKAFEGYLAEGGAQIAAARRTSLDADVRLLRARVARVDVSVNADNAEIRVDDQVVGTSPLKAPVMVSIGHRKITVVVLGRAAVDRFVDVASGDTLKVAFDVAPPAAATPPPAPAPVKPIAEPAHAAPAVAAPPPPAPPTESSSNAALWITWGVTGLFAASTAATGGMTLAANKDLSRDLSTYPGSGSSISHDQTRTKTLATVTDALLAATAVSAGIALYVTLRPHRAEPAPDIGLAVGPAGIALRGSY